MTSYIAHHTKKKQILGRREAELQRLIAASAHASKLIVAAEQIRDARIRVLRVQRSLVVPKDDADVLYAGIDRMIAEIANTPAQIILAEFGFAVG